MTRCEIPSQIQCEVEIVVLRTGNIPSIRDTRNRRSPANTPVIPKNALWNKSSIL